MFPTLLQDVRYSVRLLLRTPGVTLVALLTLALGIGANTAIFSIVNGVLLRPLPYPDAERLYSSSSAAPPTPPAQPSTTPGNFYDIQRRRARSSMAAFSGATETMTGRGEPERLQDRSAGSVLEVLGVPPQLGRIFTEADDRPGAPKTVVISDRLWQRLFGGARTRSARRWCSPATAHRHRRDAEGVHVPRHGADFWAPTQMNAENARVADRVLPPTSGGSRGVTAAPRAPSSTHHARLRAEYPVANGSVALDAQPVREALVAT